MKLAYLDFPTGGSATLTPRFKRHSPHHQLRFFERWAWFWGFLESSYYLQLVGPMPTSKWQSILCLVEQQSLLSQKWLSYAHYFFGQCLELFCQFYRWAQLYLDQNCIDLERIDTSTVLRLSIQTYCTFLQLSNAPFNEWAWNCFTFPGKCIPRYFIYIYLSIWRMILK